MKILDTLAKEEQKHLIHRNLEKGKTLFYEGDTCTSVSLVITGQIVIRSFTFSGKEIIYNTISENQMFGNNLIFSKNPFYKGDVVATKSCEIIQILRDDLIKLLQCNKQFLLAYLEIQSDFGKSLNNQLKILSCPTANERLEMLFYQNNGEISYSTISSLAAKLGLERETLSRLISLKEKRHQLRRLSHKLIKLD